MSVRIPPLTIILLAMVQLISCTSGNNADEQQESAVKTPFLLETAYSPAGCRSAGSPEIRIDPNRAIDVDGDNIADLFKQKTYVLIRSSAYTELRNSRPWVRVPASGDSFGAPGARELVVESRLGPDVGFLQPGQMGMIPQVRSLIEAGKKPPQRITSGFAAPGAPTNTSIWWKRSFDGSLRSIDVSFEDLDASVGILAQSYELGSGEVILPEAPTPADVTDVNDLPAVALLATTEDWRGVCRNDEALLSPETLACYRRVVGASTVDEWMTARLNRSWTRPEECG